LKIPPLDSYSPRLVQLRAKKSDLHVESQNKKADCAVIRARMQKTPDPGNEHESRLRKILGEEPVTVRLPDADRLKELLTELDALNAAMGTIDAAILNETSIANNLLLADPAVKQELLRRGSAFAKAFLALRDEHLAFNDLIDTLEDQGVSVSAIRLKPNGLDDPKDRSGSCPHGLRTFVEHGFISKSVAPEYI
jgi:hypothetical protein